MKLQLRLFTVTSEIRDKFHCCYWDFCMGNETGMVLVYILVHKRMLNLDFKDLLVIFEALTSIFTPTHTNKITPW